MIETAQTGDPAEASIEPEGAAGQPARRATRFMAELGRAMLTAAEHARSETMARFEAEAKSVVETIHADATNEVADLRRRADDDLAAVRDWSKAEIARIREETEARITARKGGLERELEAHAATVGSRTDRVAAVVAAFETQMAAFFERLNAEEDPTRIATMAEFMPDPPNLAEVAASLASGPGAVAEPAVEQLDRAASGRAAAEIDFAAAEAEAALTGDLDGDDLQASEPDSVDTGTTADPAATTGDPAPAVGQGPPRGPGSSRVIVSGLASVANIANFKRSLGRLPGVATIAVASGPDADFIFTVGHTLGSALSVSIQAIPEFDVQVTGESDDAINVAARDRDGGD